MKMEIMSPASLSGQKPKPVYKLRDRKTFESFINEIPLTVIVAYHYLCPQCESYVKQFKRLALEYQDIKELSFGKIHIQLQWMIKKARLKGFVTEENTFLQDYEVGKKVPATMFFQNGMLKWKIEGVLEGPIFRGLVKKLQEDKE
jgi:thiol-disulfide isomerase/thioredoxin